jgi:hypothetical protein
MCCFFAAGIRNAAPEMECPAAASRLYLEAQIVGRRLKLLDLGGLRYKLQALLDRPVHVVTQRGQHVQTHERVLA